MRRVLVLLGVVLAVAADVGAQPIGVPQPEREITALRDGVYRVREGDRSTVFLVTDAGILLVDPLSRETAQWLQREFGTRFSGLPVRYVVLTHHHVDRAEGASVFAATAEIIGHETFNDQLLRARRSLPTAIATFDRDRDGRIRRSDVTGLPQSLWAGKDVNGDEVITTEEMWWWVSSVGSTFSRRRAVTLGGKVVELYHVGPWHARDLTVVHFHEARLVFAAEAPPIAARPFRFEDHTPQHVMTWLRTMASIDFDTLLVEHGSTPRTDLVALRDYLEAVVDGVASGYGAGRSAAQIQTTPFLDGYAGTPHYAARDSQITDVYRHLRMVTAEVTATASAVDAGRSEAFCRRYTSCDTGGPIPAATAGLAVTIGQVGVSAELTFADQWSVVRSSPYYDEELARRDTRVSVLMRLARPARWSLVPVAGITFGVADTRGIYRVKQAVVPLGGRHPLENRRRQLGVTAGVDLVLKLGDTMSLILPARVTAIRDGSSETESPFRSFEVRMGVGLARRVLRRVH